MSRKVTKGVFINNKFSNPASPAGEFSVVNPATEEVMAVIPNGTSVEVDAAVKAARAALQDESWSALNGKQRAVFLRAFAKEITERKNQWVDLETQNVGKSLQEARFDIDDTAACFEYYAGLAEELDSKQDTEVKLPDEAFVSRVRYDPIGVAGFIIPWNYPLLMAAWKICPALAAGCTIVLKPSEYTPLTVLELCDVAVKIGLPAGVFNVVCGTGATAGAPLSAHPDVDKVAFTGSVPTGSLVGSAAAKGIKPCTLELGGKSPIVVTDNVDIEKAVEWIMFGIFVNNGQVCSATSRLIVHESVAEKLLNRLVQETRKVPIGNPMDKDLQERKGVIGPLVSKTQMERVMAFIDGSLKQGAKVLTGGKRASNQKRGFFVEPTVLVVKPNMTIWKEEVFGPVLAVVTYKDEKDALRLANESAFGLGAAILSNDKGQCERFAQGFQAGIVWINCSQPTFVQAPWGGVKKSGVGRELGPWGLNNYLSVKQVTTYVSSNAWAWFIKEESPVAPSKLDDSEETVESFEV